MNRVFFKIGIATFLVLQFSFVSFSQCVPVAGVEAIKNGDFELGDDGSSTFGPHIATIVPETYSGPGHYVIWNNPHDFSINNPIFSDHTKNNGSGMMLIIDGSSLANQVAWQQTVTIIPLQTYYFSAWITSTYAKNKATIYFEVKGNLDASWTRLGNQSILAPDVAVWMQIFETWNSGSNTSATIRMVNENASLASDGNDYAIDDISFMNSCANVSSGPKPALPNTISLCANGGKVNLDTKVKEDPSTSFAWQFNGAPIANPVPANVLPNISTVGAYSVCVDSLNCIQKATVNVVATLTVDLGPDISMCGPISKTLNTGINDATGLTIKWFRDDVELVGETLPTLLVSDSGTYKVVITDQLGVNCNATDVINIKFFNTPVTVSTSATAAVCGSSNGTASVSVSGGLYAPYTYNWGSGLNTPTIKGLASGNYNVTVTDAKNCTAIATASVGDAEGGNVLSVANDVISCVSPTGNLLVKVTPSPMDVAIPSFEPPVPNCVGNKYYINDNSTANDLWCTGVGAASNTGTSASPYDSWASMIAKRTLVPGDTVFIDNGTYSWTAGISSNGDGTASCYITIMGAGSAKTLITITGGAFGINTDNGGQRSYVKVSDLSLTRSATGAAAVEVLQNSSYWIFENCSFSVPLQATTMMIRGKNTTVTNTSLFNCLVLEGTSSNTMINKVNITATTTSYTAVQILGWPTTVQNCIMNCPGNGISVSGSATASNINILNNYVNIVGSPTNANLITLANQLTNVVVDRNILIGNLNLNTVGININGASSAIALTNNYITQVGTGILCNQALAVNYKCYNNSIYSIGNCIGTSLTGWDIRNNILYVNGTNAYRCIYIGNAANSPAICDNNLYYYTGGAACAYRAPTVYNTLANWQGKFNGNDALSKTGDPNFTDIVNGKLDIVAGSPAENMGITLPEITTDIMGATRNNPPEAGAFEIGGTYSYKWSDGSTANPATLPLGNYTVTVTGPSGCSSSISASINNPAAITIIPTITNIDCSISVGSISLAVTGGKPNYTYSWADGSTNSTLTNLAAGTYGVTVTDANGCTNFANPTIASTTGFTASATADILTPVCSGTTVKLTASGGISWDWDKGLGSGATQTVNPTTTTTYTVTISNSSCSVTKTVTVNVITVTANAGTYPPLCYGESVNLIATGGSTYNWDNSIGFNNNVSVTPLLNTTYKVTVTDVNGCKDFASVTITVTPKIIITTDGDKTLCVGTPYTLTATAAGATFAWDHGITNGIAFTTTLGITKYTVTATVGTCTANASVTLTVNSSLTVDAGSPVAICQGAKTTLHATGGINYIWDNGIGNGDTKTVSPAQTTIYSVTVTDASGACSNTDNVTVTVNNNPKAVVTYNQPVCEEGNLILSVTSSNLTSYQWSGPNFTDNTTATPTVSIAATQSMAGNYLVTITDVNGCKDTSSITVAINPLPTLTMDATQGLCDDANGSTIKFNYTGTLPWNLEYAKDVVPQAPVNTIKTNTYVLNNAGHGDYTLVKVSNATCNLSTDISVKIDSLDCLLKYPNIITPNNDMKNDKFLIKNIENYKLARLYVYNRWGNLVYENDKYASTDNFEGKTTSGDELSDGVYFYILELQNRTEKGNVTIAR